MSAKEYVCAWDESFTGLEVFEWWCFTMVVWTSWGVRRFRQLEMVFVRVMVCTSPG